ncbi:hypothetical protein P171DRAFT_430173 [Karstenula rhodostoma CBS 690.94]|uniref:Uncharacterized protein n=1 Tax=Karstenula rhodostoma CBS 690.94 TaxID=1392251 RepID=A0A9P4PLF7_9PLEO|nr:hypothetical protein P171DRAFT_430173 [Karstenula rhodostoma CBS 690.94]
MKLSLVVSYAFTACVALAHSHAKITLPAPTHRLSRRFDADELASDEDWKDASCKGGRLIGLMLGTDEEAGPKIESTKDNNPPSAKSEWQGDLKQELKTWGWHDDYVEDVYADMDYLDVTSVVEALRINGKPKGDGGNNIAYHIQHMDPNANPKDKLQTYKVDGKEYRATNARHIFVVNPIDGVIMGQFLESPASAARMAWYRQPTSEELPKLQRLSDLFWGYWVRDNPNIANIRYFWMVDIANEDTEEILARALSEANKKIGKWPGVTFDMDSDAGKAILGSANGAVFAWFLIQHKKQLGDKWIPRVTVFLNDIGRSFSGAHILFYVEDAP